MVGAFLSQLQTKTDRVDSQSVAQMLADVLVGLVVLVVLNKVKHVYVENESRFQSCIAYLSLYL